MTVRGMHGKRIGPGTEPRHEGETSVHCQTPARFHPYVIANREVGDRAPIRKRRRSRDKAKAMLADAYKVHLDISGHWIKICEQGR